MSLHSIDPSVRAGDETDVELELTTSPPRPWTAARCCLAHSVAERETLVDVPNVHPYQAIFESEKAAYLVRQFLASDLYDRIR